MATIADEKDDNPNHWRTLGKELWKRTVEPCRHPSFVFFFIVAILGIGPTGVWIELVTYLTTCGAKVDALRSAFISFLPAFLAATCMQLIWAEDQRRSLRAFSIFILAICGVGLAICGISTLQVKQSMPIGFVLSFLAMWLWWIANANQKEFMDDKSRAFNNPLGGDVNAPLKGNLDSFTL